MQIMFRSAMLPLIALLPLAGWMISAPVQAAGSSCDAVYDACIKQVQTPHHTQTTMKSARTGKITTSEGVFVDGVEYSRFGDGPWKRSRVTLQDNLKRAKDKRSQSSPDTCRNLGNDAEASAPATLYSVHSVEAGMDSKVWLSASGLILRQTFTLPNGNSLDSRADYENVQAPSGIKRGETPPKP